MAESAVKPEIFVGSSREAIPYARAVTSQLSRIAQVTPWYAGVFGANDYTMEALERRLDASDFGVFVFAPDDVALIRGKYAFIARDNTVFEMGLFWGKLRRKRVFCLVPRDIEARDDIVPGARVGEYRVLSDLNGMTLLEYHRRTDGNHEAAVDAACGAIERLVSEQGPYENPEEVLERKQSVLHFFWEYTRNIPPADFASRYAALSEAVRNALLPPEGYRLTGAAFWQKIGSEGIGQVGGNVGKGRFFKFQTGGERSGNEPVIYVLDAYNSGKWAFFHRREVAHVYVLCYPLGKEHVMSVHFTGNRTLSPQQLERTVRLNEELFSTILHLIGGDSG
ncbi:TIR domain-containing protein [Cohnella caldifontis]|uniref:TIR domain-containing protein n=1 Tax=Cohnella caldifontis TaxID=3027471 RepID=UPI0023EE1DF1|nr:TIR domain-containing protein [Cohnella sp. YIM B05605]